MKFYVRNISVDFQPHTMGLKINEYSDPEEYLSIQYDDYLSLSVTTAPQTGSLYFSPFARSGSISDRNTPLAILAANSPSLGSTYVVKRVGNPLDLSNANWSVKNWDISDDSVFKSQLMTFFQSHIGNTFDWGESGDNVNILNIKFVWYRSGTPTVCRFPIFYSGNDPEADEVFEI